MKKNIKKENYDKSNYIKKDTNIIKEFVVKKPCLLMDFLIENLTSLSRNNIKSLLTRKQVAVDGAAVSQFDFMLAKDDVVMIGKNSFRIPLQKRKSLDIIYEDDEFIVINKPSGLLSIASDNEKGMTAYRLLMDYYRRENPHNRIYVVHRLDKDTSGVLMVAKNEEIRDKLQNVWNDIVLKRGYYAIVEGTLKDKKGTIKSWLRQTKTNIMYSSFKPGDGQESITDYNVIKEKNGYSLVDINLHTGRKNQIRVHMKDIGHNVVGDDKYGSTKNPINRLGLHAYELEFIHPVNKKKYTFKAPIPEKFNDVFKDNFVEYKPPLKTNKNVKSKKKRN